MASDSQPTRSAHLLGSASVLAALLATSVPLFAHGGQYRGAADVQPPTAAKSGSGGSGSGSSSSGGSSTAGTDASSGSSTGSSTSPTTAPKFGRGSPRGVQIQDDPSSWETWWEFRKDPLIRARDAIGIRPSAPEDSMLGRTGNVAEPLQAPTPIDLQERVLPALHRALRECTDRDTATGCMVALAKIGVDLKGTDLGDVLRPHLRSRDQEVRETAALCFGIARRRGPDDVALLCALALDEADGRKACDRASVDERTRSFAAFGLGLFLADGEAGQREVATAALLRVLAAPETQRDLTVAAVAALGQLGTRAEAARLRAQAVAGLDAYYTKDLGPGDQLLQAQCPIALAQIVDRSDALADRLRERFAADLGRSLAAVEPRSARSNNHIAQSCAIALGRLARPWTTTADKDAPIADLLLRCYREHKDQQTRYFAILALGHVGGPLARAALLREFERANKAIEKPWVGLALAALLQGNARTAAANGVSPELDREVAAALRDCLATVKNPSTIGAIAVAMGICQIRDVGDSLRELLRQNEAREELAGQLAVALALLGERRATEDLRALLPRCVRRPQLLVQVATALGRLGDADVVDDLAAMLGEFDGGLARLSAVASAIGHIGDRRCIDPLLRMLADEHLTPLTRAFAAVALGGVCDRDPVPWNARFAASMNYRAAVETVTDGAAGILDIL